MKPVAFEYERPATVGEACRLLAADGDARVLAGGQTLIPMLAMRLARPSRLVDIARIPELSGIRDEGDVRRHRGSHPAGGGRARSAHRAQGAAAGQGAALGRACADPQPRHRRRVDRQWRSGRRDPAGGRHPRCDIGGSDRRGDERTGGRRVLSRPDDHGAAGGRHPHLLCAFPSGPRAASAPASTRWRRAEAISPSWRRRRRSRWMRTAAARRSRSGWAERATRRCAWTLWPRA